MVLIVGRNSATRRQQKNHPDRQGIGELQILVPVSQVLVLSFPWIVIYTRLLQDFHSLCISVSRAANVTNKLARAAEELAWICSIFAVISRYSGCKNIAWIPECQRGKFGK